MILLTHSHHLLPLSLSLNSYHVIAKQLCLSAAPEKAHEEDSDRACFAVEAMVPEAQLALKQLLNSMLAGSIS